MSSPVPRWPRRVPLAWKMVTHEGARFVITTTGVGFTVMLMLFLFGVYEGVQRESNGYVSHRPADAWLCQDNSTNLIRSSSYLGGSVLDDVREVPEVAEAAPLLRVIVTGEIDGRTVTLFLFGVDAASPITAPGLVAGRSVQEHGEIVLDRAFAAKYGLAPGDSLRIQERAFRVTGLSEGTNAIITQFAFTTLADAQRLLGLHDVISFVLATGRPGVDSDQLADTLAAHLPRRNVFSQERFVRNNLEEMQTGMLPILLTVAVFGALSGGAVLMLMLYGGMLEKRDDYALLKAIGAPAAGVVVLVLRQSLLVVACGLGLGFLLYGGLSPVIVHLVPEIALALSRRVVFGVALATLLIGVAGSILPVRKLGQIMPAEVFRA